MINTVNSVISGLQATTLALDLRVTILEENGGSDGNSSVAELEVRVETLEGTAVDHEIRISATESDVTGNAVKHNVLNQCFKLKWDKNRIYFNSKRKINEKPKLLISDLEKTDLDHETRLTAAEENIQGTR